MSKATEFTPGPWVAISNGDFFDIGIANFYPNDVIPVHPTVCLGVTHRQEANARLIAAAPELYEALASIENDDGNIPKAIWDMRNAALAKARGEHE